MENVRKYYKQLHANKWDTLDEMNTFLEICKWLKCTQEEIEDFNRLMTTKEI